MRVVMIGPVYPYRGGIAHYTTRLHQAITESDHEVLLVSFRRQYPHWLFPGASDRDPSRTALEVSTAHYWLDSLNPLTWLATFWRIRCFRPQRLVLQWWTSFWAPVWLTLALLNRLWLRSPLVFLCHNVLPHDARWWERWVSWLTLRWGNRFIVQSEQERERLLHLLPSAVIDIVPHPVYTLFAGQRVAKSEARQRLNLPEDAPVLLFFGIVRPYKGLADLIEALPAVRRAVPEIRLLIAGEFWHDKVSYLARIHQLHLEDLVQIDDRYIPNEEVGLYFSAADALVAPYRVQTGSGVIELARGFGLPVISPVISPVVSPVVSPVISVAAVPTDAEDGVEPAMSQQGKARPELLAAAIVTFLNQPSDLSAPADLVDEVASWQKVVRALEGMAG